MMQPTGAEPGYLEFKFGTGSLITMRSRAVRISPIGGESLAYILRRIGDACRY